jgi:hypothetical protein
MRHLLVTYTVRFNRRSGRTGHLFQGRFKSLLVEQDEYLLPLSRYIHLNPIRTREFTNADITTKGRYLRSYKWSTLAGYRYLRKRGKQIDYRWLLDTYFSGDIPQGRRQYWQYVCSGIEEEIKNPFEDVAHQAILGTRDFVEWVKERVSWEKEREVPSLRRMRRSLSAEEILEIFKAAHGVEGVIVLDRGRKAKTIRQMAMELCYRYTPMTQREIGEIFGVDYSTVSQNRRRLSERLKSSEKLRKQFERIDQSISNVSKTKS